MSGANHEGATEHVGADDAWATQLRGIKEDLRAERVPAWVDDPDPAGLAKLATELDEIETRMVLALDALVDRARAGLERAR